MNGSELIAQERQRQIAVEGWTPEHDREHDGHELVYAACTYLLQDTNYEDVGLRIWPWDAIYWKPTPGNRVRELVKAGALIAAEIDRLQSEVPAQPTEEESR